MGTPTDQAVMSTGQRELQATSGGPRILYVTGEKGTDSTAQDEIINNLTNYKARKIVLTLIPNLKSRASITVIVQMSSKNMNFNTG